MAGYAPGPWQGMIVGAGPAGLYFAILMKKARALRTTSPSTSATVSTTPFGFGVVFSDQTLDNFEALRPGDLRAITREFVYWDDIDINFKGTTHRIGGNGFCGCCAAARSSIILHERARGAGGQIHVLRHEVDDIAPLAATSDLVVPPTASTRHSGTRTDDHFGTEIDLRPNKFAWMGATTPLDAFTFAFGETEWGVFIAHAYQYQYRQTARPGCSRSDRGDLAAAGLGATGAKRPPASVHRAHLRPPYSTAIRLHHQPLAVAELSDGAEQALGEGQHRPPRRRQVDGAFLDRRRHQARDGGRDRAATRRSCRRGAASRIRWRCSRRSRRDEVERTQHSADVSLVFFEHIAPLLGFRPGAVRLRR